MTGYKELIGKCIAKDARAEYALYKACYSILMRICCRYAKNEDDAAALLNKGFLKILNNLEKYDTRHAFESWIKTIMVNTIIDEFRMNKKNKETFRPYDIPEMPQQLHPSDVNDAESKITVDEIIRVIRTLPDVDAEVFNLFVFEGLSHKEIGAALSMPEGTSRWHLANARMLLKKKLAKLFVTAKMLVL